MGFNPWVGKIPWSRKWYLTPVFLLEFHGQRSLAGYSPWDHREADTTGRLSTGCCNGLLTVEDRDWPSSDTTRKRENFIVKKQDWGRGC